MKLIPKIKKLAIADILKQKERKFFPISEYGVEPIYTKEWVQQNPVSLILKDGKGTLGSAKENNGVLDITDMYMNAGGHGSGAHLEEGFARGKHMIDAFEAAPHGQVISMGKASSENPLSLDSYPLMLKYLTKLEKEGKGMFIETPQGHNPVETLNYLGEQSFEEANAAIEALNSRYGTTYQPISRKALLPNGVDPDSSYGRWLAARVKNPKYVYNAPSIEFIKFKNGGNI